MVNIFKKHDMSYNYLLQKSKLHSNNIIKWELLNHLYENLSKDNRNLLDINLENALTTTVNGKYI
jgi:hypothetical protein